MASHNGSLLKEGVSYDTVMILFALLIPLCMLFLVPSEDNPYMDSATPWLVLIISLCVVFTIKLNQRLMIPLLDVFVLVYLIFWHLRFLTLSIFPQYELVLTRTVSITPDSFNHYTIAVLGTFLSAVAGFFIVQKYISHNAFGQSGADSLQENKSSTFDLSSSFYAVLIYGLIVILFYTVLVPYSEPLGQGLWLGYIGMFFHPNILMYLLFMLLFSKGLGAGKKFITIVYLIFLVLAITSLGSRSAIITVVLAFIILKLILRQKPKFSYRSLLALLILTAFVFASFIYATFLRDYKLSDGILSKKSVMYANQQVYRNFAHVSCSVRRFFQSNDKEVTPYCKNISLSLSAEESVNNSIARNKEISLRNSPEAVLGLAFARAGYLDFSAELYLNDNYNDALNIRNIVKSIIDNSLPGMMFGDSRRIEHRMRDIYNPAAIGYQSDALGIVGENYRLLGSFYPLSIILIGGSLLALFSIFKGTVIGLFCQYSLGWAVLYWCNSYGYDTLVLDISRQLLAGIFVLFLIRQVAPKGVLTSL